MQMSNGVTNSAGSSGRNKLAIVSIAVMVLLALIAGYFFWQYTKLKANPDAAAQETTQRLVTEVDKLYQLPDEKPTVAQINDKDKLKEQPFFKSAQNGDYLLIFTNAKLAVLYREDENKLINVGPIAITPQQAQQQNSAKKP
jgi:hypothetical protein